MPHMMADKLGHASTTVSALRSDEPAKGRLHLYDVLRGFSVVSMVAFHLCYDLKFINGVSLPFFASPFLDLWRNSISWAFVLIAGCMYQHSRDNFRRAGRYLALALAIYVVTAAVRVDTPISFGIIYCMGACTLSARLLELVHLRPSGPGTACLMLFAFVCLLDLKSGSVGLAGMRLELPETLFSTPYLSWLGFPGPRFVSGDYYPLLPFGLMYLVGANVGVMLARRTLPTWVFECGLGPLALIGRHPLLIYLLHQPLLLVLASQVH